MPFPQRVGPIELDTVNATIFTANRPSNLKFLSLTNRTAATRTVTVNLVPVNGTAGNGNYVLKSRELLANDFDPRIVDIPMSVGDTLQAFADAAGVILIGKVDK